MLTNDENKSCVKCQKAVKRTEKVLVCGLWCGKSFHNDCVGVSNSETRVVTCSKQRLKFHCETCESRLGIELSGEKETLGTNKLENCLNNCILEFLQKILELTNKLSNDNSVINTKLDTVINSNARLEEYVLQSPKCFEKRSEVGQTTDNSLENVESFSCTRTIETSEENSDTNSGKPIVNGEQSCCASKPQQTDVNSSSPHIVRKLPKQLSSNHPSNVADECSSNCLQELEVCDDHNGMQDLLYTNKDECSPSEDFLVCSGFSVGKTEYEGGEEKAVSEIDMEECSPSEDVLGHSNFSSQKTVYEGGEEKEESEIDMEEFSSSEDFLRCNTFSIENIEDDEDGEAVGECSLEELKHEVESTSSGNEPESNNIIGMEDKRNKDDISSLFTEVSQAAVKGHKIQCITKQEVSSGNKSFTSCVVHRCDICRKTFRNLQELKEHTKLQNSCKVCHKTFMCSRNLEKHFQMHTRENQIVGDAIDKISTFESLLKRQSRPDSGERPYSCSVCNKTFRFKSILEGHSTLHSGERPYNCSICNKKFRLKTHLEEHSRLHSGERPHRCCICHKTFVQSSALRYHLRLHSDERPYSCSVCRRTFTASNALQQHSALHSGKRPYGCSVCSKTFKRKTGLQKHLLLHSGERPYSCSICSKAFLNKSYLNQHLKLHSREPPYRCSICNRTFSLKRKLQKHFRVHPGGHPYRCSFCGREFRTKECMTAHFRLHTGERPYSCSDCHKTFVTKNALQYHLRLHSGERPYSCSFCNKTFIIKSSLNKHSRLHSGECPRR